MARLWYIAPASELFAPFPLGSRSDKTRTAIILYACGTVTKTKVKVKGKNPNRSKIYTHQIQNGALVYSGRSRIEFLDVPE
jgi:hypothetical protein